MTVVQTMTEGKQMYLPRTSRRDFLRLGAAASLVPGQVLADSGHDLALLNGRVVAMDASRPSAEAVLIRNGRIVHVGTNAEVERQAEGAGSSASYMTPSRSISSAVMAKPLLSRVTWGCSLLHYPA